MWSARRLRVALSTQQLVLVEHSRPWSRRPTAVQQLHYRSEGVAESAPWRPAVDALTRLLAQRQAQGAALHVVLCGRFARWQLLPWRAGLTRPQEWSAYAAVTFQETFGAVTREWQVQPSLQPPQQAVPACAVDAGLLRALRTACAEAGATLATVAPYFSVAFDHWRSALEGRVVWFGVLEADSLALGLLQQEQWLGLRSQRLDSDWRELLPGMMAQIGIQAGLDEVETAAPRFYLTGAGEAPAADPRHPFVWLQPRSQTQFDGIGCRMALGL
ncbi:MAG TPA: hypothetical protein PL081_02360 [Pseudomonadales bacterium]|nr:hypothetical protein [Pseudomonadales bacterium]HMU90952.1 hypothetical protein [Pseudomonadales bacterium]HMW14837.1 hypothetical protein [Pseudomonadales bacterium]HMW84335.1 hypothetical protein [Pseudomonadales bacterium]HMY96700.1 hypothetical protein [Pseudomonadales bacterium]